MNPFFDQLNMLEMGLIAYRKDVEKIKELEKNLTLQK